MDGPEEAQSSRWARDRRAGARASRGASGPAIPTPVSRRQRWDMAHRAAPAHRSQLARCTIEIPFADAVGQKIDQARNRRAPLSSIRLDATAASAQAARSRWPQASSTFRCRNRDRWFRSCRTAAVSTCRLAIAKRQARAFRRRTACARLSTRWQHGDQAAVRRGLTLKLPRRGLGGELADVEARDRFHLRRSARRRRGAPRSSCSGRMGSIGSAVRPVAWSSRRPSSGPKRSARGARGCANKSPMCSKPSSRRPPTISGARRKSEGERHRPRPCPARTRSRAER